MTNKKASKGNSITSSTAAAPLRRVASLFLPANIMRTLLPGLKSELHRAGHLLKTLVFLRSLLPAGIVVWVIVPDLIVPFPDEAIEGLEQFAHEVVFARRELGDGLTFGHFLHNFATAK